MGLGIDQQGLHQQWDSESEIPPPQGDKRQYRERVEESQLGGGSPRRLLFLFSRNQPRLIALEPS